MQTWTNPIEKKKWWSDRSWQKIQKSRFVEGGFGGAFRPNVKTSEGHHLRFGLFPKSWENFFPRISWVFSANLETKTRRFDFGHWPMTSDIVQMHLKKIAVLDVHPKYWPKNGQLSHSKTQICAWDFQIKSVWNMFLSQSHHVNSLWNLFRIIFWRMIYTLCWPLKQHINNWKISFVKRIKQT